MIHSQGTILIFFAMFGSALSKYRHTVTPSKQTNGLHLLLPIFVKKTNKSSVTTKTESKSTKANIRIAIKQGSCKPELKLKSPGEQVIKVLLKGFKVVSCVKASTSEAKKLIEKGKVDLRSVPMTIARYREHKSFLYPHRKEDIFILVKRRQPVQQSIVLSFATDTWVATGVTLVVFAGALRLCGRRNVILEVFDAFINGGFATRESDRRGNFLFLLLSAFGLVIVSAFTGTFMGFLAALRESPQIETLEEVASQVSRLYIPDQLMGHFKKIEKTDVLWKLQAKFVPKDKTQKSHRNKKTAFSTEGPGPGYVLAEVETQYILQNSSMMTVSGAPLAHLVKEPLVAPSYVVYRTRHGWRYKDRLDKRLQAAVQAGLVDDVYRRFMKKFGREAVRLTAARAIAAEDPETLKLPALKEPAIVLGAGLLAATVRFLVEVADRIRAWWRRLALRCISQDATDSEANSPESRPHTVDTSPPNGHTIVPCPAEQGRPIASATATDSEVASPQ